MPHWAGTQQLLRVSRCSFSDTRSIHTLHDRSQDLYVQGLIAGDFLQVLVEVWLFEAGLCKVILGEVGESLLVEGGLEVL